MKNGTKNNGKSIFKIFQSLIKQYRQLHKDDINKLLVTITFAFVSSILIQDKIDFGRTLGTFLLVSIIFFLFYKDIRRYKPGYLKDHRMLLLLGIIIVSTLFFGRIFEYLLSGLHKGLGALDSSSFIYGIPIPMGAMLVKLIFDFHTAMIFSFAISILTGLWLDSPLYLIFYLVGSLTAVFSVMRCKKRSALIKAGIFISGVNMATVGIIMLLEGSLFTPVASSSFLFASMSGIMVASIVFIILPAIEYVFKVTTDISLVELLDLDQPLMRNLMIAAPGTYHHSVIVGNLAEAAAEVVNANPLLAKVTAYYHDIGKIKMPEYFVENQQGTVSKHEKLTSHMSGMILISHVKEGVELAKQYKLPKLISDIIQQHHGTSLITYFYKKAMEEQISETVSEEDYRYPGPKPQTKVAAIVMMADAVEAASRALSDPSPSRIAALVDKVINNIFLDGQIDECELTLKDISEIKKRFTYILTSIFHRRIEYPETKETPKAKAMGEKLAVYSSGN